jgi:hypothetical protein
MARQLDIEEKLRRRKHHGNHEAGSAVYIDVRFAENLTKSTKRTGK